MTVTESTNGSSTPRDLVVAYITAAAIFLIGGLPAVASWIVRAKLITAVIQLAFILTFAYALFRLRRAWATALIVLMTAAAVIITALNVRDGFSVKHVVVTIGAWAFASSLFLLLHGVPSRRKTLLASLIWLLITLPASLWARFLP
jgi:hypothetical protein